MVEQVAMNTDDTLDTPTQENSSTTNDRPSWLPELPSGGLGAFEVRTKNICERIVDHWLFEYGAASIMAAGRLPTRFSENSYGKFYIKVWRSKLPTCDLQMFV